MRALAYFSMTFCFFQILKELFQMMTSKIKYFKSLSNYLEWSIYVSAIAYLSQMVFGTEILLAKQKNEFGIIGLYLGWINILLFLKRVPICKLYVLMFFDVCLTLSKVILVFGVVFLAFIFTFYQLFPKQDTFKSVSRAMAKVIVMVSGELDYESFITGSIGKTDSETTYPLVPFQDTSYVMVVFFVFFMVIALMNLLVSTLSFVNNLLLLTKTMEKFIVKTRDNMV